MDIADDSFWRFSLDFYGRPGVGPACLALQDETGADVNLVLFLLWCAAEGRPLDARAVAEADERIASWRREVVEPLRAVRRALKRDLLAGLDTEPCRNKVKAVELQSERLAQAALFAAAPATRGGRDRAEAARENLALYEAHIGRLPGGALETLLAAFDAL